MSRETKFGYGFLFVGTGLPYIITELFGPLSAAIASSVCLVIGIGLLVAGHRHPEEGDARIHFGKAALVVLLMAVAVVGIVWALMRHRSEHNQEQEIAYVPTPNPIPTSVVTPPAAPFSSPAKKHRPTPNPQMPTPTRPYDLTGARREKFLALLRKTQTEPRDVIRIGCISWSDAACVAAGKFLILFSEAGWTIDQDRVFRMEPMVPIEGMAMVTHVDMPANAQKLPPHLGTWKKMDASEVTIYWAFKQMGIPVASSGDNSLPVRTLGIYFGPEPQQH